MTTSAVAALPARVGVLGCGLLGTSVGLRLAEQGVEALLADADPDAVATAVTRGAGRPWDATEPVDLAVVAVPPGVTGAAVRRLLHADRAALATDVASVKRAVQAEVEEGADVAARFCGGHPMAGRERGGALRARADLFEGRPWVVTPGPGTSGAARDATTALASVCGADVVVLDPARHDEAVALVSHLPQLVASLAAGRLADADADVLRLAGQGLRDTLRIARSDPWLWGGIVAHNADAVADVLRAVRRDLDDLLAVLGPSTSEGGPHAPAAEQVVVDVVGRGRAGVERLPGKHGAAPRELAEVSVVVDDRPGRLAALLQAAGDVGVNVEDLRIDHAPGRAEGVVDLLVAPVLAGRLAEGLRAAGWSVPAGEGR